MELRIIDHPDISSAVYHGIKASTHMNQNWHKSKRTNHIIMMYFYFQDVLQQLLVVKLPNIQTISRDPEKGGYYRVSG